MGVMNVVGQPNRRRVVRLVVQLFLCAIERILLLLTYLGLAPWPQGPSAAAQLEPLGPSLMIGEPLLHPF